MIQLKDVDYDLFQLYWDDCVKHGSERKIDHDAVAPVMYLQWGGLTMAALHAVWLDQPRRLYVDQKSWDEFNGVDPDRVIIRNCTVEVSRAGNTPLLRVSTKNDNHIQVEVSPELEGAVFELNAEEVSCEREKDFRRNRK